MGQSTWAWITSSQVLAKRPCKLYEVSVSPSAAAAYATVYNGENTTEPQVIRIDAAAKTLQHWKPAEPVRLDRGLYVALGDNVTGIFVQYEPEE